MIRYLFFLAIPFAFASCAGDFQAHKEPADSKSAAPAPKRLHASEADPDSIEGKRISEVQIRYVGPQTVDEARLRNLIGTKAGGIYASEQVDSDIKDLYESGNIDDVRVLAEPAGSRVRVIYEVTPRPPMGRGFVGNTVFSGERLAKETGLRVGGKLTPDAVVIAAHKLEEFYRAHGYAEAHAEAVWENGGYLFFRIQEGPRTKE